MKLSTRFAAFIIAVASTTPIIPCLFAMLATGQTQAPDKIQIEPSQLQAPIHAESDLVVIRALVMDQRALAEKPSDAERRCLQSEAETLLKLPSNEPYLGQGCHGFIERGLTAKDFRLSVEGSELQIEKVIAEGYGLRMRDSNGRHVAFSETPMGIWSSAELRGALGLGEKTPVNCLKELPGRTRGELEFICHTGPPDTPGQAAAGSDRP